MIENNSIKEKQRNWVLYLTILVSIIYIICLWIKYGTGMWIWTDTPNDPDMYSIEILRHPLPCIYEKYGGYIYWVAYLPIFFVLWYPFTFFSLTVVCNIQLLLHIYAIYLIIKASFRDTWIDPRIALILSLIGIKLFISIQLWLSLEIVIFAVFYYFFSDINQYSPKQLVAIAGVLALVNFKIYSTFWMLLYFIRLNTNKKRFWFVIIFIFFNIIFNIWICFLCPQYASLEFWLNDFGQNVMIAYYNYEDLKNFPYIIRLLINAFRQRMLFTIPCLHLLLYGEKRLAGIFKSHITEKSNAIIMRIGYVLNGIFLLFIATW